MSDFSILQSPPLVGAECQEQSRMLRCKVSNDHSQYPLTGSPSAPLKQVYADGRRSSPTPFFCTMRPEKTGSRASLGTSGFGAKLMRCLGIAILSMAPDRWRCRKPRTEPPQGRSGNVQLHIETIHASVAVMNAHATFSPGLTLART